MELDLLELDTANTLDELERELDELERELDEMELERELEELDLLELNELERELDETNSELDELKTGITELDFELEKFEDDTGLICDIDENELLLKELIATELETTALLELEVATLNKEDLASDDAFEGSSITASPPQALNRQNRGTQNNTLIFTLFYY